MPRICYGRCHLEHQSKLRSTSVFLCHIGITARHRCRGLLLKGCCHPEPHPLIQTLICCPIYDLLAQHSCAGTRRCPHFQTSPSRCPLVFSNPTTGHSPAVILAIGAHGLTSRPQDPRVGPVSAPQKATWRLAPPTCPCPCPCVGGGVGACPRRRACREHSPTTGLPLGGAAFVTGLTAAVPALPYPALPLRCIEFAPLRSLQL